MDFEYDFEKKSGGGLIYFLAGSKGAASTTKPLPTICSLLEFYSQKEGPF